MKEGKKREIRKGIIEALKSDIPEFAVWDLIEQQYFGTHNDGDLLRSALLGAVVGAIISYACLPFILP